ncbi:MAG: sarcosine oxidase subunit gamma family protein [Pseudomonadota bacterium]
MIDVRWQSPLGHREPLTRGTDVAIAEIAFVTYVTLRGQAADLAPAVGDIIGLPLPTAVTQSNRSKATQTTWLGPDEWVISAEPDADTGWMSALETALDGTHHQLVTVSDQYATIAVSGAHARDLLAKLVVIDLHPRAFGAGTGVATVLAKAHVWLWHMGDDADGSTSFRIATRRAHADYVWCLLAESGREWGLPPQKPIGRVKLHLPHFETSN